MGEGKLSQTEPTKWDLAQKDQSSSLKPAPESRPQGWRFTSWLQGAIPSSLHSAYAPPTSKPPKENPEPGWRLQVPPPARPETKPRPRPTQDAKPRLLRVPLCTGAEAPACGSYGPAGGVSWGPGFGVTATTVSSLGQRGLLVR